jgi:hypothetical protein
MKKYKLVAAFLCLTLAQTVFSQGPLGFQILKGKKYNFRIEVPKGDYNYSKSSSEREHYGTYNEPYIGVYAYKDAWFPGGELGMRDLQSHLRKGNLNSGNEMLDYTEVKKDIPNGYKYESTFKVKDSGGKIKEYYVILAVLAVGKYKFNERIWAEATLVFNKENADKELIVSKFFESFNLE